MSISYRDFVLSMKNPALSQRDEMVTVGLGLVEEAGEFTGLVKKWYGHGHPMDRERAIKELGDVRFYLEWATFLLDTTLEEIEAVNKTKLYERFPEGFSTAASIARRDVG